MRGQPKLTGRRGIQIWIPVAAGPGFERDPAWVEQLSRAIGAVVPELVSWKWDVHERGGLARLDYTQNASNKTLVAPYSPRAAAGAPVSAPLEWDELDDPAPAARRVHDPGPSRAGWPGSATRSAPCWSRPGAPADQLVTWSPAQPVSAPDPVAIAKMCIAFMPFPTPLLTVGSVTDATVLPPASGTEAK